MSSWMESGWMTQLGWILLHSVWQFPLVAFCIAILSRWMRHSAGTQHVLACGGLMLVAACPILTWWLSSSSTELSLYWWHPLSTGSGTLDDLLPWLSLAWIFGFTLFSIRPVAGCWGQLRLARGRSLSIPDSLLANWEHACCRIGIRRTVELRLVDGRVGPMLAGWFRPIIYLPISLTTAMSRQEIELLLAHELAHVRRHDCWINTLQVVIETFFFYHPAVWWLSREVRIAREQCCDNMAAPDASSRLVFARALLTLEQNRLPPLSLTLSAGDGDLLRRIRRLSTSGDNRNSSPYVRLASGALVAAATVTIIFALTPRARWSRSAATVNHQESAETTGIRADTVVVAPPSIEDHFDAQLWDLHLDECVSIALQNQVELVAVTGSSQAERAADRDRQQDPQTRHQREPADRPSVVLARKNEDQSLFDFEIQIRNLVRDVEVAYWDLFAAYRDASARIIACDVAKAATQIARRKLDEGTGAREDLALAIKHYHEFRTELQAALAGSTKPGKNRGGLIGRERQLRGLMGLAARDGRLLRPIEAPADNEARFDFDERAQSMLSRSPEIRRNELRIRQLELELSVATDQLANDLHLAHLYRWIGNNEAVHGTEPLSSLLSDDLAVPSNVNNRPTSLGARRELTRIRGAQLRLKRESGFLREQRRLMVSQLNDALASSFSQYQLLQSHARRWRASEREYAVRFAGLITDRSPIKHLLRSQTARSEAQIAYYRALAEYNKSTNYIAYLSGTMLAENHITLADYPR